VVQTVLTVAAFALIGGGIKYIDEAFDEKIYSQKIATAIAAILLVLWIGISILDTAAATILLAVLLGVLFTGKIDNTVFGASTSAIVASLAFLEKIIFLPLLALTFTGIIDEKGNDYVDSHKTNKIIAFFFLHRFTMKVGLLTLSLAGVFALEYLLAFLFFDISYDTVGFFSGESKKELERNKRSGIESPHSQAV
jgi:hypothetical protein